jgi:hypothetical protein
MQDTLKTSYLAAVLMINVTKSDSLIISSSFLSFSDKVRPIPKANELSNIQTARTNKNEKVSYL